ncbi:MAG: hypothetical protein A3F46_02365, partial [Legionellales bacterium RIFCSPHIGHO2_12_FULL_42_9]
MRFNTGTERMAHPQARLIPWALWKSSNLFYHTLHDAILPLMQANDVDLINLLEQSPSLLQSSQLKKCAWLAIAFSHPDLSNETLAFLGIKLAIKQNDLFDVALKWGKAHFLNHVFTNYSDNELQAMIAADDYSVFSTAAFYGQLEIVNRLLEVSSPAEQQAMIAADDYYAFRLAALNDHLEIVNRLLSFPAVFVYAERHEHEYGEYVYPFINDKLTVLRAQKAAVEQGNPDAVFDTADVEEAKLCFYVIRNLIRRNNPALLDDIRLLLEIPAVKALAHTAVTPQAPNE